MKMMRVDLREMMRRKIKSGKWMVSVKEMKKVIGLAAPMVGFMMLMSVSPVISVMMVGHLDELSLSGASIATSFANVSGFAFLVGMGCALETLCGQAYGAEQYEKLGIYMYGAIICLVFTCFPISVLWIFTDKLLMVVGIDHSISITARNYSIYLIPRLFGYAIMQPMFRFLQTQSLISALLVTSVATVMIQIPLTWLLVFKTNLRCNGAALALSISMWLNVLLLALYIKFSPKCAKTRASIFSKQIFPRTKQFILLAIPSTFMTCLEWWASEGMILVSGLLPNPKLQTSVVSICFTIVYIHYFITFGFGATISTRVSNELGAGNSKGAKMAVATMLVMGLTEVLCVSTALFILRHMMGYTFSNQKEVVDLIADLGPFMCLLIIIDCVQAIFSGVVRGSGWQKIGAYVNLGAYYIVGFPVGVVLAFVLHLKSKGLLIGFITGAFAQATTFALLTFLADWQKQASKVRERLQLDDVGS